MSAFTRLAGFVLFAAVAASPLAAGTGYGQVSFQNNTNVTGTLQIDDGFGCGPVLMNLLCTTHVRAGAHTVSVKFNDGDVVNFGQFEMKEGASETFTVNMPPPKQ